MKVDLASMTISSLLAILLPIFVLLSTEWINKITMVTCSFNLNKHKLIKKCPKISHTWKTPQQTEFFCPKFGFRLDQESVAISRLIGIIFGKRASLSSHTPYETKIPISPGFFLNNHEQNSSTNININSWITKLISLLIKKFYQQEHQLYLLATVIPSEDLNLCHI